MIGSRLRELRRAASVSVEAAAAHVGRAKSNVYAWEEDRHGVDPVILRKLLELYGCSEATIAEVLDLRSRSPRAA